MTRHNLLVAGDPGHGHHLLLLLVQAGVLGDSKGQVSTLRHKHPATNKVLGCQDMIHDSNANTLTETETVH